MLQPAEQSELAGTSSRVRPARASDLAAVLSLIEAESAGNPWLGPIRELVETEGDDAAGEFDICVVEWRGEFAGCGIYGPVLGTIGTAALYFVGVESRARDAGTADAIVAHMVNDLLIAKGARLMVAEVPGYESFDSYRSLLVSHGFVEESRIDDYYGDGIPVVHYRFDPNVRA